MQEFESVKKGLAEAIDPILKDNFMELVEIEVMKGKHIRVIIDKIKEKVSIDDCTNISRLINSSVNLEEIASGNYSLEVSSPGIDRPLKKKEHFEKFIGERAKIITTEPVEKEHVITGTIIGVRDDTVIVENEKIKAEIKFDNIKKANLDSGIFKGK